MTLTQISTGGIKDATIKNEDIEADTIQLTKLQNMATNHILGRSTSGTGNPEIIGAAQTRTILNVADGANQTIINNNADNRVITGSGTANTLNGESGLTYDSTTLVVSGSGEVKALNNTANSTDKQAFFTTGHRNTSEENVLGLRIVGGDGDNVVDIGGGSGQSSYNAATKIRFYTGANDTTLTGTERLRINPDGNIGVGTTSPDAPVTIHNSSDPEIRFGYSGTQDHRLGWDSSKITLSADPDNQNGSSAIRFDVDGSTKQYITDAGKIGIGTTTPDCILHLSGTAANLMSRIRITDTTNNHTYAAGADGNGSFQSTINDTKHLIYTNGVQRGTWTDSGLCFKTDTAAANALDDYEEGTWNITVSPGGGSYGVSHMNARYTKIGNVVSVQGWWRASSVSGVAGALTVSGFPYATLDYSAGGAVRQHLNLNVAHVNYANLAFVKLRLGNNSTQGSIMGNTAGASGGLNTWTAGNIALSTELYINGSYLTAS